MKTKLLLLAGVITTLLALLLAVRWALSISNSDIDPRRDSFCPYQTFGPDDIPGLVGKAEKMTVQLCGTETEIPLQQEAGGFYFHCVPCPRAAMPCSLAVEFQRQLVRTRFLSPVPFDQCGLATAGVETTIELHPDGGLTWESRP